MVRVRVVVSGTVQGVAFRASCQRQAIKHQASGWVRNLVDGSVEAVFEGPSNVVQAMVDWTRHGPPAALVTRVDVHEEATEGLSGFAVRN